MKDLGLSDGYRVLVTERCRRNCDGLCRQYIINEDKSVLSSSSPPSRPTAASTVDSADAWRYASTKASPATVRPSAATTRSIRWPTSQTYAPSTKTTPLTTKPSGLEDARRKIHPEWREANFLGRGTVTVSKYSPRRAAAPSPTLLRFLTPHDGGRDVGKPP
ncbi:MAG: hypothetical protein ACLUEQ_10725 [Cloacibacillus evryensis]